MREKRLKDGNQGYTIYHTKEKKGKNKSKKRCARTEESTCYWVADVGTEREALVRSLKKRDQARILQCSKKVRLGPAQKRRAKRRRGFQSNHG